ncbi:MAG: DHH family phosphoesterase [Thermoguttaceae bacterium]
MNWDVSDKVAPRKTRSQRLLDLVAPYEQVLVVTHDNPDPDAIAAGWAILYLVEKKLAKPGRLIGGGAIVRAENRHMVKLLGSPIELVRGVTCPANTAVILVDCAWGSENHLFNERGIEPVAVLDHHRPQPHHRHRLPFQDVRHQVAASATIAACYLREQEILPTSELATALLYAIRTETRGNETYHTRLDRSIVLWLSERADFPQLAEIENAPLTREYFSDLVLALQSTLIYEDTALCLLPRASGPEIVGEVADLLIRCEAIQRVLCGAVVQEDLVLSVRTAHGGEDATELLCRTLDGIGKGGGHLHRAGGKIPGRGLGRDVGEVLRTELPERWLAACGMSGQRGTYLIARREIVENL